ncbi:MAG: hypothetical protein NTX41_05405 [Verrucomicrobia bacterium]|nr:hypothetical protein [Verrucomicrobiota bacterium]
MHLTQEIKDSWEMEEDPEYGYREVAEADVTLMSLEKIQLLIAELRVLEGTHGLPSEAMERVCDYVARDPVYSASTRLLFRSTIDPLRPHAG